jgi:hypothetical protein
LVGQGVGQPPVGQPPAKGSAMIGPVGIGELANVLGLLGAGSSGPVAVGPGVGPPGGIVTTGPGARAAVGIGSRAGADTIGLVGIAGPVNGFG